MTELEDIEFEFATKCEYCKGKKRVQHEHSYCKRDGSLGRRTRSRICEHCRGTGLKCNYRKFNIRLER